MVDLTPIATVLVGGLLTGTIPALIVRRTAKKAERAAAGAQVAADGAHLAASQASGSAFAAKEAITNGHPEHARDQWDRQHAEQLKALRNLSEGQEAMRAEFNSETRAIKSDVRGIRRDVGAVRADHTATTTRLDRTIQRMDDTVAEVRKLADQMGELEDTIEVKPS